MTRDVYEGISIDIILKDNVTKPIEQINRQLIKQKSIVDQLGKSYARVFNNPFKSLANFDGKSIAQRMQSQIGAMKASGKTAKGSIFGEIFNTDLRQTELYKGSETLNQLFKSTGTRAAAAFTPIEDIMKNLDKEIDKGTKSTKSFQNQILTASLGVMFLGMAMKRTFDTIWKGSTKVFQDVMHSVDGTTTAFDEFNGAMSYLKFVTGEALAPIIEYLTPIVEKVAEWASENPGLVAGFVTLLGVVGTVFGVGGQLALGLNSITAAITLLKDTKWSKIFSGAGSKISSAIGVVSVVWAFVAAKKAYDDFKKGNVSDGILNSLSAGSFGAAVFIKNPTAKAALFAVGVSLQLLESNKFFATFGSIFGLVSSYIRTWVRYIVAHIEQQFRAGWKHAILDAMIDVVDKMSSLFGGNFLIKKIFGKSIGELTKDLAGIKDVDATPYNFDFKEEFIRDYANTILGGEAVDAMFKEAKENTDQYVKNLKETGDINTRLLDIDPELLKKDSPTSGAISGVPVNNVYINTLNVQQTNDELPESIFTVAKTQGLI